MNNPCVGQVLDSVADPSKVYFQNSNNYPFHYDFAKEYLTPFIGMSPQAFDNVSLYEDNQKGLRRCYLSLGL